MIRKAILVLSLIAAVAVGWSSNSELCFLRRHGWSARPRVCRILFQRHRRSAPCIAAPTPELSEPQLPELDELPAPLPELKPLPPDLVSPPSGT